MPRLEQPPQLHPFILASHDTFCRAAREWNLRGRKGSWSLWTVIDGRVRWERGRQHDSQWLQPGQALLRWRGVAGKLHLPRGCRLHGIEFDVQQRRRESGDAYGWWPLSNQGAEAQPRPDAFFHQMPPHLLSGTLATSAERLLSRIAVRWWRNSVADQLSCNLQLAGWLAELSDSLTQGGDDPIERAEVFARQSLQSECTVTAMARVAGMPLSTFSELYSQRRRESASAFLRRLRLEAAAAMLVSQQVSIAVVCHQSGYLNAASFSRSFKEHFGLTPKEYRAQARAG